MTLDELIEKLNVLRTNKGGGIHVKMIVWDFFKKGYSGIVDDVVTTEEAGETWVSIESQGYRKDT